MNFTNDTSSVTQMQNNWTPTMTVPNISFEFFPPKTIEASFRLWDAAQLLAPFDPRFVSVTFGALGSTRKLTLDTLKALSQIRDLRVAGHLTCVNATRDETLDVARSFRKAGILDIVALRGDPPHGQDKFEPTKGGFRDTCDMITALREEGPFSIRVGAYPHVHPEARSARADIDWLKRKIDAGASEAITQFFFEADDFLRFRDACVKAGITAPIVPGILPIENWRQTVNFAKKCGTPFPSWLKEAFEKAERDDRCDLLSVAVGSELCSQLIEEGVENLHFYTLNTPELSRNICFALGLEARKALRNVA